MDLQTQLLLKVKQFHLYAKFASYEEASQYMEQYMWIPYPPFPSYNLYRQIVMSNWPHVRHLYKCSKCNMTAMIEYLWYAQECSVFVSEGVHYHPNDMGRGFDSATSQKIVSLYDSGVVSPRQILHELKLNGIHVDKSKVYNFISRLKKKRRSHTKV